MAKRKRKFIKMTAAEFFKENAHIAGFSNPVRSVYQTVRELVENALDATETHGILPNIRVGISWYDKSKNFIKVSVRDNGVGIPAKIVPNAFGTVLFSSKYVLRQTRGVFGLGVKMAVLYAQMTTGKPVEVLTKVEGESVAHYFMISIDTKKNAPIVLKHEERKEKPDEHYTVVSLIIEGDWGRARPKVLEYLKRTHVLCPYTEIRATYPDGKGYSTLYLKRATTKLPKPPKEIKPHPHGIDLDTLNAMIEAERGGTTVLQFLTKRFSSIGDTSAKTLLKKVGISPKKKVKGLSREERLALVRAMKQHDWRPPPASALSPVGPQNIEAGLKQIYKPEFVKAVTRSPSVHSGHPFIVEAGIAYGGKISPSDKPVLLRYANKIPLLYDEGVDVARKVVDSIDWRSYGVEFPAPLVVLVHVASTRIPYHTLGKEAIADVPEIEREIRLALQEVGRHLRRYLHKKESEIAHRKRVVEISKYFPVIADALSTSLNVKKDRVLSNLKKLLETKIKIPENKTE